MALAEHHLANEVVVTRDGEEALDYLHRRGAFLQREPGNPVVMLLDLKMPRVDGLSVLKAVRSDPNLRLIPIVLLTSSNEERDILEGYNLGVNAYVVKPVDFHEFVDAIKKLGLFWSMLNVPPPAIVIEE
jgi:CheY-like chemotaxis protein